MKKLDLLPFLQGACFLLISLLLQNCGGSTNLPIGAEEESAGIIEQIEGQGSIIGANQEQEQKGNSLPAIMPELWQEIFSYLKFGDILAAKAVNRDWNELITGFREVGIVGVENKPCHIIDTRGWTKREQINFYFKRNLRVTEPFY
jgi:hypothetical protein